MLKRRRKQAQVMGINSKKKKKHTKELFTFIRYVTLYVQRTRETYVNDIIISVLYIYYLIKSTLKITKLY